MPQEMIFCAIIMVIGIFSFSFVSGSLTSIICSSDVQDAALKTKQRMLERIYKEHCIPLDLFIQCKKHIDYNCKKNFVEIQTFIDEFPYTLKKQLSLHIHFEKYKLITFLRSKPAIFVNWMCSLLKPVYFAENQYIYFEGDDISSIYFLIKGYSGFVLPKYNNTMYIQIQKGDTFGVIDIIGSCHQKEIDINEWINRKYFLQR